VALNPPPLVKVAAPVTRPPLEKRIFWPSAPGYSGDGESDSIVFPCLTAIKARHAARPPAALSAFVEAVWEAQERILVLDSYLFEPQDDQSLQERWDQILFWLPDNLVANDIRFLTDERWDQVVRDTIQAQFNERAENISRSTRAAKIEIRFSLNKNFPYVHDRFAIIDNELWHFGATVGGLHSQVNAASRGWDATSHDAIRFFDVAWKGDDDTQRGGRHG